MKKNITLYKLAHDIGVSESTFSKWKSKPASKIDVSIIQKIAEYFNVSASEVLLEVDSLKENNDKCPESLSYDEIILLDYYKKCQKRIDQFFSIKQREYQKTKTSLILNGIKIGDTKKRVSYLLLFSKEYTLALNRLYTF